MEADKYLSKEVLREIKRGRKVNAIKILRQKHNLSFSAAKEIVDAKSLGMDQIEVGIKGEDLGKFLPKLALLVVMVLVVYFFNKAIS
ncbi:hypothetical protein Maes01_01222 [Microbulbifer aestuariivivens]|uniref:Ribosomal protein L7/L12 C-terminal domain-containing protein n=1 Tax=Microbulbifer aestuariivivens TaxID=1908308 RepID=A0ABP9WR15_9GAMM